MANDDRIKKSSPGDKLPKPEIRIIKDGDSFFKPSMKTFFVDEVSPEGKTNQVTFGGTYCSCNSVCTCNPVVTCTCVGYVSAPVAAPAPSTNRPSNPCSCVSYRSSGGGCSCNKVCTCVPVT